MKDFEKGPPLPVFVHDAAVIGQTDCAPIAN